jgi:hypothetical protein
MIEKLFSEARVLADRCDQATDDADGVAYLSAFIAAQPPIARALDADEALRYEPAFTAYVDACAPVLSRHRHSLAEIVDDVRRPISGALEGDEWFIACERRSAIESLREVFAESDIEAELARNLDTQALDDRMRAIGEVEGPVDPKRVPRDVPERHWWWRYPAR